MSQNAQYEMKDSGVEWIGEIPKEWKLKSAKHCVDIHHGSDPTTEGDIPVYGSGAESFKTCGEYKEGPTVLIGRKGATLHIPHYITGKYWNVDTAFDVKAHSDFSLKFYYYLAICFDYKFYISQTTLPGMTQTNYRNMPIPVPLLIEQQSIASYLDEKCAAIDEIITEAKTTIDEYKSWKVSVIFEAVTKGLDKNADMKYSDVEWIGRIPKDWKIISLRYLGKCQNGISKDGDAFGSGFPFVSYTDVYKNIVLPEDTSRLVESTEEERERYSVKYGDIFFTRTSETIEEIGFSSVCLKTIDNATFAGFLIRFRPTNNQLYPEYSKYYFRSELQRRYFVKEMTLVTRASLGQELLKSMPVILPPFETQQKIAAYLDEKCAAIDGVIAEKEALIGELESYKKSLIFETVTGKRRVC